MQSSLLARIPARVGGKGRRRFAAICLFLMNLACGEAGGRVIPFAFHYVQEIQECPGRHDSRADARLPYFRSIWHFGADSYIFFH